MGDTDDAAVINEMIATPDLVPPQSYYVSFDDEYGDSIVESPGYDSLANDLSAVSGIYWLLRHKVNDCLVWKQQTASPPNTEPLIIWKSDDGWWCSDRIWRDEWDRRKVHTRMWLGWGDVPETHPHIPTWSKHANTSVTVESYTLWLEKQAVKHAEHVDKLETLVKVHHKHYPILNDDLDPLTPQDGQQAKSQPEVRRGGWMDKFSRAAIMWYKKDDKRLHRYFDQQYSENRLMAELVDAGLRKASA